MEALSELMKFGPKVDSFLGQNTWLIPLIRECYMALRKHFPTEKFRLEYIVDPEGCAQCIPPQVGLIVECDTYSLDAFASLQSFDLDWWLENMSRAQDRFFVNIGFGEDEMS